MIEAGKFPSSESVYFPSSIFLAIEIRTLFLFLFNFKIVSLLPLNLVFGQSLISEMNTSWQSFGTAMYSCSIMSCRMSGIFSARNFRLFLNLSLIDTFLVGYAVSRLAIHDAGKRCEPVCKYSKESVIECGNFYFQN